MSVLDKRVKHGFSRDRLYNIWNAMNQRCINPNNDKYYRYGGRGIKVCPEWYSFIPFKDWALSNGYSGLLTIDRDDVNGDYTPSNCYWKTNKEQQLNKEGTIRMPDGTPALQVALANGVSKTAFYTRRKYGWTLERAVLPL